MVEYAVGNPNEQHYAETLELDLPFERRTRDVA